MIVYKQRRSLLEAGLEQTDQATASSLNIALEGALGSMAFQFVNTTADKRKPDDKTRKKIRSQVMKDYRRRREEGEAGPSAGRVTRSPSTSGRASPQIDTRTARSQVGRLSRASSTGEHATPPPEVLGERSTKRGRPGKIQQQQAASLFLQTAHGLFSNFTVDLSAKTSPQEDRSPSRDESELNRMLEICERYNEWLIPGRGVTNPMAPDINDNSQAAKMQLYALTLMSIGHLSAVGVYDGEDERAYYKARLLGIAHRLLQDPERALQDATVGALACLTSYEISFGSSEALTHLSGISRIIEWKGGLEFVGDGPGLPTLLEALDLLHAVYYHTEPVFTVKIVSGSSSGSSNADDSMDDISSGSGGREIHAEEELQQWQTFLREAAAFMRDSGSLQTSRACYLAWRIHSFQPHSTASWTTQSLGEMDELHNCMMTMPADAFDQYPALQTRILLTALATATKLEQKSWYYSQLSRLMFHTEARYWDQLKTLVTGFIECQAYFHRPIQQTVKAMVSGVEIVIERSLAEQLGLQIIA